MTNINLQATPAPPNWIRALQGGFDAVASHLGLILFPVLLDLLLWFGPRMRVDHVVQAVFDQAQKTTAVQTPELIDTLQASQTFWANLTDQMNLLSALRSFPVGIASLMAGRNPTINPVGQPLTWQAPNLSSALGIVIILVLIGVVAGSFYFISVALAVVQGKVSINHVFQQSPWIIRQTFGLLIFWLILAVVLSLPLACLLFYLMQSGSGAGQFLILLYAAAVVWFCFPLVFSPHGIFIRHQPMWVSIQQGAILARRTLPSTSLLFLTVLLISQGFKILWSTPPENSWFSMVGIIGHAFITTSLLAGTFIFYLDAQRWLFEFVRKEDISSTR